MREIVDIVYSEYMDKALQVTVERGAPDNSTGNGLLHAGLFYTWLGSNGAMLEHDSGLYSTMCYRAQVDNYPGLFHRSLWKKNEWQSHDDYVGIMGAGYFAKSKVTGEVMKHGRGHWGCWNNLEPEKWTIRKFFPRFPWLWPFFKMCNREFVFLGVLPVAYYIFSDIFSKASDGKMRVYIVGQVARERSKLCDMAFDYWKNKTRARYGTIGMAFKDYFGDGHPLTLID